VILPVTGAIGLSYTVTILVLKQPSDVRVYVRTALPAAIPVTTPELFMVAINSLLLAHDPEVPGVTWIVEPTQSVEGPPGTGSAGIGLITASAEFVDVQV
jgi:hypothetical protein